MCSSWAASLVPSYLEPEKQPSPIAQSFLLLPALLCILLYVWLLIKIMRVFALCVLTALLASQAIGQKRQPNSSSAASNGQQAANTQNPASQVVVQSQSNEQPSNQQTSTSKNEDHSILPSPEWVTAASTFFILIATSVYSVVSYCTLQKIKKQAEVMSRQHVTMRSQLKAMEGQLLQSGRQAEAAIKNANSSEITSKTLVNSERPWIFVEVRNRSRDNAVEIVATNKGRTPAALISVFWDPVSLASPLELSHDPKYGNPPTPPIWIVDQPYIIDETNISNLTARAALFGNTGNCLMIFGRLVYKDALTESKHESHFCYRHSNDNWIMDGPRAYNENT